MEEDQKFKQGIEWLLAVCRYELRSLSKNDKDCLIVALKSLKAEWHMEGETDAYKSSESQIQGYKKMLAGRKGFKGVKK